MYSTSHDTPDAEDTRAFRMSRTRVHAPTHAYTQTVRCAARGEEAHANIRVLRARHLKISRTQLPFSALCARSLRITHSPAPSTLVYAHAGCTMCCTRRRSSRWCSSTASRTSRSTWTAAVGISAQCKSRYVSGLSSVYVVAFSLHISPVQVEAWLGRRLCVS